jgi:hypothetical protein
MKLTNRITIGNTKRPQATKSAPFCDRTIETITRSMPKKACPAILFVSLLRMSAKISPIVPAAKIMAG